MTDQEPVFDFGGFYRALDATRSSRNLTWKQVGLETRVHPSTLARMQQGKRPDANGLAALAAWASVNPADFVDSIAVKSTGDADSLARISQVLRRDKRLSEESAKTLEAIVKSAYAGLADRS